MATLKKPPQFTRYSEWCLSPSAIDLLNCFLRLSIALLMFFFLMCSHVSMRHALFCLLCRKMYWAPTFLRVSPNFCTSINLV